MSNQKVKEFFLNAAYCKQVIEDDLDQHLHDQLKYAHKLGQKNKR